MSVGNPSVLFVDDDRTLTGALIRSLNRRAPTVSCHQVQSASAALEIAAIMKPHVAVVDLDLGTDFGAKSGLKLIGDLLALDSSIRILVLTGHGREEHGLHALQQGAASYLNKPVSVEHLLALVEDGVSFANLKRNYQNLETAPAYALLELHSKSPAMQDVIDSAAFAASTNQPVLLVGETGTGKGVVAKAIHRASERKTNPFIRFQPNFGSHDLVSSELFGHQRGAFTGAHENRRGLIEDADRGTLFIDEVDELPSETQVMLLNVLQEKVFRRIGSNHESSSDFRLIAATNRDIDRLVEEGRFREDFYHRVAHLRIEIPPLRERHEDLRDLADTFASEVITTQQFPINGLSADAIAKLRGHNWPGNVRELRAVIDNAVHRAQFANKRFIEAQDISFSTRATNGSCKGGFRERVRSFEVELVNTALSRCENNQSKAAAHLNMDRSTLRRILARAGS